LSDIRLTNAHGVKNDERVFNAFRDSKDKSYNAILHSSKNSRGVGILIANNLEFDILSRIDDPEENFLVLKINFKNSTWILAAIYGPNAVDRSFVLGLKRAISRLNGNNEFPVVIGVDWNCTWDESPVNLNIDVINMANIPNQQNSISLRSMCNNLNLCDPFRIIYPHKRDYSYQPFGTLRRNRSRIDFFAISTTLIEKTIESKISAVPTCSLFDHRLVTLHLGKGPKIAPSQHLSNRFLGEKILDFVLKVVQKFLLLQIVHL
jgi:exonuclease III